MKIILMSRQLMAKINEKSLFVFNFSTANDENYE